MNGTSPKVGRLEIFDGVHWRAVSDTFEHGYITPKLICDKLVEEGSYRNYDTDSEFGNGLVVPKYSYACPKDADSLDECLVVDASGHVTDERPISLYCDKCKCYNQYSLMSGYTFGNYDVIYGGFFKY